MTIRVWLIALLAGLVLSAGAAAAAAIPGPQRALCPQCFGLTDIGGGIFTDAPERAAELRDLVEDADRTVAGFFGDGLASRPRYIFCAAAACQAAFGPGTTGISYGSLLIRIAPNGFVGTIVTHERLHAEIAARAGFGGLLWEPVPVWFNEGLAAYLASDARYPGPFGDADIAWIERGVSRAQWNALLGSRDWIAGYGSAQTAIARLDSELGRARLVAVARLLIAGDSFEEALTIVGARL